MARLEDLTPGTAIQGIFPDRLVTVVNVQWSGTDVIELIYRDTAGALGSELLFRDDEPRLTIAEAGRPWSFDANGEMFRLVSEAYRIRLAYLFDPLLAVHTSLIEPLPHQITAVYGEMLPRQPLRFLLADDPGAGKTIMTGLLIKELLLRGDLHRCLIVCPGSLTEQWQDELGRRFGLPFEILTNDKLESARTGNWFLENPLAICRLDRLARREDIQAKLEQTDWDLIVCDEAHKMSASFFGGEIRYTKRHRLGQLLAGLTRHFLLLSATPHNGKEEDFQLFMSLLDGDRFEGRFRDGVHVADTSDLMRRMVKEDLVQFDGTPLFPERKAYTVNYKLSDLEAELYRRVTEYVREEFNRADALENEGRRGTIGFALTVLQRRLASSPEAIYQSLRRRRERLESRLREERLLARGATLPSDRRLPLLSEDDLDELEDAPESEVEELEEQVVDQASAARTVGELEAEIATLRRLEDLAQRVRRSGRDRKWEELSGLLHDNPEMFDPDSRRRKLVIFTEHRDTLNYLSERIRTQLGTPEAVVNIHGGMGREDRKKAENAFVNDPEVLILVATDAAGEGINLQRAHLMVNADLPWNPNRLEQRFGRIHRIGQEEVCHLWNLVAEETREGDVFLRLLKKLETERDALGGAVFDVLGQTIQGSELRKLLLDAIRYGDQPEVRARLERAVDMAMDHERLRALMEERALARETLGAAGVQQIREEMERAEARRLQPHFVASFFLEAFQRLGGRVVEREPKRWEIKHVPARIRARDRQIGRGDAVLPRYERITFEKERISVRGKPPAAFIAPGHPLLDATIDLVLEQHRDLLKRGTVLVDPADTGEEPRALFYLEHAVQDGRRTRSGERQVISRQIQFVEIHANSTTTGAGYAPYLNYRPLDEAERALVADVLDEPWLREGLEQKALGYAVATLVPPHLAEVKQRREERVTRTMAAVKDRLTKEIIHWDHRAQELRAQEQAGKQPRINWQKAQQRADELSARLERRMEELEQERRVSAAAPVAIGGALVVPAGLLARLRGERSTEPALFARETRRVELAAMAAVAAADNISLSEGGTGARAYAEAIGVYLSCGISRSADFWSSMCIWANQPKNELVTHLFGRQAIPMAWDFAEANPFSDSGGNFTKNLDYVAKGIAHLPGAGVGHATQVNAAGGALSAMKVVSTDPPYFDNIGYACLSDYFYVWLRRSQKEVFPNLFHTLAVPKTEELVAEPNRHGGKEAAEAFFLKGMTEAMRRLAEQVHPIFPVTIYYAFKQAEDDSGTGTASTGWETFIEAVIDAGFAMTGTWPTRTERTGRMRDNASNALASSIVLVCRKQPENAPTATRRDFLNQLKAELPEALRHLQRGNIAPVDLAQAAIGPGMAVYTRYARVLDAAGTPLAVREALSLINQTLDEVLAEQEGDFDAATRWALAWFEQFGFDAGDFGQADVLARAKNTSVGGLAQAGVVQSSGGKVRLLRPAELPAGWDPATDARLTHWEGVHHLIRVLEADGESAAAALVGKLGAAAETARELAYRLYVVCERKKRPPEALSYNALVQSWPEIARLAQAGGAASAPAQMEAAL